MTNQGEEHAMHTLTTGVILPAVRQLRLTAFVATDSGAVLVPMAAPAPGTPPLQIVFLPDDAAGTIVIEAPLFAVPPARVAAVAVSFATVCARYRGVSCSLDGGAAYAAVVVDVARAANGAASVADAFAALWAMLRDHYAEIVRLGTGAPRRRTRAEQQIAALVAPFATAAHAGADHGRIA